MVLPKNGTIIFFSPHADDESIAAAALIYELVQRKNRVKVFFLANSPKGVVGNLSDEEKTKIRQQEGSAACEVLGAESIFLNFNKSNFEITDKNIGLISEIIKREKPALVLTTSPYEAHPTHAKTTKLVQEALRGQSVTLWFGEVWSPVVKPNYIHYFDEQIMDIKIKALSQYSSQLQRTNWIEACRALNKFRALTGKEVTGNFGSDAEDIYPYAEAFEIREISAH